MTSEEMTARQLVVEQVLYATTRGEIEAARAVLKRWIRSHPRDAEPLADGFALLANLEEALDSRPEPHAAKA
jgi:anti-sigma factor RsiW